MMRYSGIAVCLLPIFFCALTRGQSSVPAAASVTNHTLNVSSTEAWTDTQVDLHTGDVVRLTATTGKGDCNPEGLKDAQKANLLVPAALPGALLGKLGTETPFLVGSNKELTVNQAGHLYLGMNAGGTPACNGELAVTLQVTPAATGTADIKSKLAAAAQTWLTGQFGTGNAQPATSPATTAPGSASAASSTTSAIPTATSLSISNAALDPQLSKDLDGLPRRVSDEFKNLGDMVNFVIVGSQEQLEAAFKSAAWHLADLSKEAAIANAIMATYQKQDYLQMPMSILYLFNRAQDFGYEQAEAYSVAASRHHFRIWKAPFTWNGQPVWIGAGTHDIGFEKDQRNGKITHKIDPAVDAERDHIGATLQKAGKARTLSYYLPSNPINEARNATGGSYHSDGRVLVIFLQ